MLCHHLLSLHSKPQKAQDNEAQMAPERLWQCAQQIHELQPPLNVDIDPQHPHQSHTGRQSST